MSSQAAHARAGGYFPSLLLRPVGNLTAERGQGLQTVSRGKTCGHRLKDFCTLGCYYLVLVSFVSFLFRSPCTSLHLSFIPLVHLLPFFLVVLSCLSYLFMLH